MRIRDPKTTALIFASGKMVSFSVFNAILFKICHLNIKNYRTILVLNLICLYYARHSINHIHHLFILSCFFRSVPVRRVNNHQNWQRERYTKKNLLIKCRTLTNAIVIKQAHKTTIAVLKDFIFVLSMLESYRNLVSQQNLR